VRALQQELVERVGISQKSGHYVFTCYKHSDMYGVFGKKERVNEHLL
jgi:hypothetical protein